MTDNQPAATGKGMLWTGRIMSILPSLFLIMGGIMDLAKPEQVVKGVAELGYPETVITGLGIVVLISTALYLFPRTAILGAILLTGYLGGAVASHLRLSQGAVKVSFPVLFGVLLWGGLFLRDARLRSIFPWRK